MKNAIFISGVGKRLGLFLAQHFIGKGQQVVGTFRSQTPGVEALFNSGATLFQCDFYQQGEVDHLIAELKRGAYTFRALIHNASDWLPDDCGLASNEVIRHMMKVHVDVPYQINLALADHFAEMDEHRCDIIHVTDYVAEKGSQKHIAYAASKAAMESLTLSFASKFAPKVKVNSIAPALMLFKPDDNDAYKHKAKSKSLLQTTGGVQEFIDSVEFIMASQYMTGRTIHLDGGRHLK